MGNEPSEISYNAMIEDIEKCMLDCKLSHELRGLGTVETIWALAIQKCIGIVRGCAPCTAEPVSDTYNLTQRIEESLAYFCDEFPKASRPEIWSKPISHHCGGITPDDLQAVLSILYARKPVSVDLEKGGRAIAEAYSLPMLDAAKACAIAWGLKYE